MFQNNKLTKVIRSVLLVGTTTTVFAMPAVMAFENDDNVEDVERIAITGSRIRKFDFVSNAPVTTVDAEEFSMTATVNTESLLNTLPQVVPDLDRTSNNPGNGTATINLRGLGTNRTLVLLNGTRAIPTTSNGAVDINSIPTALIETVEVLTGGASAVYGSDAVAGVVNFILKDDFEGVELSSGYETTEKSDARFFNLDLTLGGNFADGKGNVVFNIGYTERDALFQRDRSFSETTWVDDGAGGLELGGSSGVPETSIFAAGLSSFSPDSEGIIFEPDGSVRPFIAGGDPNDYYNYAPKNYIQLPQERHQITALGHYDINDNTTIYGRAMFTDSRVPQQLAPTPIFQDVTFTLDSNPFLTPEAQQILSESVGLGVDSDGNGIDDEANAFVRRRLLEVGPRRSEDSFNSFQLQTGLRGFFGDSNWAYDAYYQTGKVNTVKSQLGNVNSERFQQALLLDLVADPTGGTCQDTAANGSIIGCVPINIFGENNISQEGAGFLKTAVSASAVYDQKVAAVNISGDTEAWFELPGGAVGVAFGYEHREESFEFLPSQDLAAGTIAGFNGVAPLAGAQQVSEYYIETALPILNGVDFAEVLEVELAYRYANYDSVGSVESYKIAGAWAPINSLRFRVGFNTAVRAPNIGELFSAKGEGYPGAKDPCSSDTILADQSEALKTLCVATGVPADTVFGQAIAPISGQVREISGGNSELFEEEAETLTLGVVFTPTDELSISLDYFDIEIEAAIEQFGGGTAKILQTCYNLNNSAGGLGSDFCNVINRRNDGLIDFVDATLKNSAVRVLKGYDLITSYKLDLFEGALALDYVATYTTDSTKVAFEGDTPSHCAGYFGSICEEPLPDYKHRMTAKWSNDDISAQLLWRHIGKVSDDDLETDYSIESISARNYFDASISYSFTDNYRVTAGIDNLLDKRPPIIGDNDQQSNTYPATYDVFGRSYFVNMTATF